MINADNLRATAPWWLKIALKIVLSRIPIPYRFWARLGIFKLGSMTNPAYALSVFQKHYERAHFQRKGDGFVCLELGPGDSLYTAPIATAFGAAQVILVDTGRYASADVGMIGSLLRELAGREGVRALPALESAASWEEILARCSAEYLPNGIESLRAIPEGTVDFAFSNAVFEHVRLHHFRELLAELRRVMRPGGVASHTVDLTDHLDGGLNNLRFSESLWEGSLLAESGFYTNRIRFSEMLGYMASSGFRIEHVERKTWQNTPLPRSSMNPKFACMSDEDLQTFGFEVVLRAS